MTADWKQSNAYRKGEIGEGLVDQYLLKRGIVPYRPIADAAHPFDRLCASSDKKSLYVVEIKSKPKREFYPDTGFNYSNFLDYMNIAMKYGMDVFVYFVDERMKKIYGGELLSNLAVEREVSWNGKSIMYPLHQGRQIYFPISCMEEIANLGDAECEVLHSLRRSNYDRQQSLL